MKLDHLIREAGDAVSFQNLDGSATRLHFHHKKGTEITFRTDMPLTHNGTEQLGLIVWIPRDKAAEILKRSKEDEK